MDLDHYLNDKLKTQAKEREARIAQKEAEAKEREIRIAQKQAELMEKTKIILAAMTWRLK